MEDPSRLAQQFLTADTQFHLGFLPTEQSHPRTRGLAETLQQDLPAGIRLLQAVDEDVQALADRVLAAGPYQQLVEALTAALAAGRRVCFSGCGATGRLSILLEAMWRRFWHDLTAAGHLPPARGGELAGRVTSIMTGGDYALIRSVEGFEDYPTFGRQQVIETGLSAGDVLVAISEGGETSSVIGTLLEARERGARLFFVFNNPADVLAERIERSREVIECDAVTVLDLTTGPMGVTGSTRMQATTAELLVVGAALEEALGRLLPTVLPAANLAALPAAWRAPAAWVAQFRALLADLAAPAAVAAMASWIEAERALYAAHGRVTYFADACLLDIFTDTTERSPTFMLPPFRKADDLVAPPSWAFVKQPLLDTPAAWRQVLGREPRCLTWDAARYRALGASAAICDAPPALGPGELRKFLIGREDDPSRYAGAPNLAMAVLLAHEPAGPRFAAWRASLAAAAQPFAQRRTAVIGPQAPALDFGEALHVPCALPVTPLGLWDRLGAKLVLNTVSTATMGALGRIVSNWMANVECSNKKLIDRGTRLVAELAGVEYETACHALHQTIAAQRANADPSRERVSPVAATIERLRAAVR